jgi:hypothetical protein
MAVGGDPGVGQCVLSAPEALMAGMIAMAGQKSGVSFGVLSTGPPNGVIEMLALTRPAQASHQISLAWCGY